MGYDLAGRLMEIAENVYTGAQHIAGGRGERSEAERIAGIVEDVTELRPRLVETPLISWRLRSVEPNHLLVPPYVESCSVKARVVRVQGDPADPSTWRPGRGIALVEEPGDPDDVKAAALLAHELGYEALVVESSNPRVIVVNGYWGYSYRAGSPSPIPVAYTPKGVIKPGMELEISIEAETVPSVGYTIEAVDGEAPIAVGAHYDRWLTGFQDNMLGVAQAILLARMLARDGEDVMLTLFTAEEHGAPGYASWYWSWGSRFYFTQLEESGTIDSIKIYINFDVAGSEDLRISGSPQLIHSSRLPVRRWECPECDSLQAAVRGVPTISIHGLWGEKTLSIYHTRDDTPENANPVKAAEAVLEAYRLARMEPRWSAFTSTLNNILASGPLEARRLAYIAESLVKKDPEHGYRLLARILLKPVHYGSYRLDEARLEALWIPEASLLPRITSDPGRAPLEVWEPGRDRLILAPRAALGSLGMAGLVSQVRDALREYSVLLESLRR